MSAFDKVIGYEPIKEELIQICDMIHNREAYERLGARMPQGILLHGAPGVGKTLMARCFVEEAGLTSFVIRRDKGSDDFIKHIVETFEEAGKNQPCIVFLDDMDKFANEDRTHQDAEEYVAVQACIDGARDSGVTVIATANDIDKLPGSLIRTGRFDRRIMVHHPAEDEAEAIISHYLSDKPVDSSVNMEDLTKMIRYRSCAELETILNEAAISAASARKELIEMDDFLKAVLRLQYGTTETVRDRSEEKMRKVALHEAGHLVAAEVLYKGSIGLASIRPVGYGDGCGFVNRCSVIYRRPHMVMVYLAGKAAVEMYYSEAVASGCGEDLSNAAEVIEEGIIESGTLGLHMISSGRSSSMPDGYKAQIRAGVASEMERLMLQTRELLLNNRKFLEKAAEQLLKKETLLYSEIRAIRESCVTGDVSH